MARNTNLLKASEVWTLPPRAKPYPDGGGLLLFVSPNGGRRTEYRFQLHGVERRMGLGSLKDVPLVEARKLRDKWALVRGQHKNPIEERDKEIADAEAAKNGKPESVVFEQCLEGWLKWMQPRLVDPKDVLAMERTVRKYAAKLLTMAVDQIDSDIAHDTLDSVWRDKHPTAVKLLAHLQGTWNWGKTKYKKQFPVVDNPFAWGGNLAVLLPESSAVHKEKNHKSLPWEELPPVMAGLRSRTSMSARLLEWTVLNCSRVQESLYAKVGEINEAKRTWTVPAARMKGRKGKRREHKVPLSRRAMEIYAELSNGKKPDAYLFSHPDGRHLSTGAMDRMLELMNLDCTTHGFRTSFRTWLFEATEFRRELGELQIAHKIAKEVEAAYERPSKTDGSKGFEKRREVINAWCEFCASSA